MIMRSLLLISITSLTCLMGFSSGFLQPAPFASSRRDSCCHPTLLLQMSTVSSNEELLPGIAAIDAANPALYEKLTRLRSNSLYFRLFSVDILASCEYMPQELFECYSESCEIYPVDEDEVPDKIKVVDEKEADIELDGWSRWDMPSEDYYDTAVFPEGYTGYDGREVWHYIHSKICFEGYGYDDDHWKADFNKAVSGLHTMISAQVTRSIQERVDSGESFSDEKKWRDPSAEFQRRISPQGENPKAMENLYFSYMLVLQAANKAKDALMKDVQSGKIESDAGNELQAIFADPLLNDAAVAVASSKLSAHAQADHAATATLWQARMRSRDLVRIMNCVQCNKCRLHGKISTMGLATALSILVGESGQGGDVSKLDRVELATLVATLHKFATAIDFCHQNQQQ